MSTLKFDFRHYYHRGERREADKIAYQWDLGHLAEIYVPQNATYHISYAFNSFTKTDNYEIESITVADDGGYLLTAHIPNKYFEQSGELRVYMVGEVVDYIITTYEGYITIRNRLQPDGYVDPDPENGAHTDEGQAHVYAQLSEAWAVGTIDGAPVESTDPQYENYSKYHADQAADSATAASGSATDAHDDAVAAAGSAAAAASSALLAQTILGSFATYEEDTTASRAYKVGEYLVLEDVLYRVTVAIASGGTITVGTNVEATTVGDEIANRVLWLSSQAIASTSGSAGTLATITDARITADHVMVKFVPANSSYITSAVTCTTSAGQAVITGTSTAATTAEIVLEKKDN